METYGLIGFPLKHSFSARFFSEKFAREKIDAEYLNFEIEDITELRRVILFNPSLKGLNVTIPYKEQVIPFLHTLSPEAKEIGAVNVIRVTRSPGEMYSYHLSGYNTDYIGFRESLRPLLRVEIHTSALILGTGGASKAVAQALKDMHIAYRFVSRTPGEGQISYDDLTPEIIATHKLIVNASPVGSYPKIDNCPAIPYEAITSNHLLYDLVYNPAETLYLKKGKEAGATTRNGKEMLELQAEAAWKIWQLQG
ncbi:shikimate dehydrogenase [Dysgonomonadaceae bacterium zrk40]|nr:shikimate dehydrogenase [Dysgonomonadaceae bacterium zrk40]